MGELIERLRNRAEQTSDYPSETLYYEAADELSALRERVAELGGALASARHYVSEAVDADGGIDACEIHMRHDLEAIDSILAKQGGEGG